MNTGKNIGKCRVCKEYYCRECAVRFGDFCSGDCEKRFEFIQKIKLVAYSGKERE